MATRKHHLGKNVRGETIRLAGRSKGSYVAEMAKWNRAYEKEIQARNAIQQSFHGHGVGEGDFDRIRAHEAKMHRALEEMNRVHKEAKDAGHWVSMGWHKYHGSTYAKLVAENRD